MFKLPIFQPLTHAHTHTLTHTHTHTNTNTCIIISRGRSPSDICLNRRELYKSSFLAHRGETLPEEPSEAQLQGVS